MLATKKTAILIDEGYFEKIEHFCFGNPPIDYLKLSNALCEGKKRFRTFVYYALPHLGKNPSPGQQELYDGKKAFIDKLKRLPDFEVRLGSVIRSRGDKTSFQQQGVDNLFKSDLENLSWKRLVDYVVIIAGDGHFVPAVTLAKRKGIHITLYHRDCYDGSPIPENNRSGVSAALESLCDSVRVIEKGLIDSVLMERGSAE